jgi:hypothetical protein
VITFVIIYIAQHDAQYTYTCSHAWMRGCVHDQTIHVVRTPFPLAFQYKKLMYIGRKRVYIVNESSHCKEELQNIIGRRRESEREGRYSSRRDMMMTCFKKKSRHYSCKDYGFMDLVSSNSCCMSHVTRARMHAFLFAVFECTVSSW